MTSSPAIPESFHSGTPGAADRIAIINVTGTISPPFTERWIRQIDQAARDESVRGVLLAVDSPGGLVADSHQIYRRIQKLAEVKPVHVAMKRLAASGGYYISMGIGPSGRIYVEPTTWTGSIGVILPRYNATELATSLGVSIEPLQTGPYKDTLNPFRDMRDDERVLWDTILQDAFQRFVTVITENRSQLEEEGVRQLATGQIYTATQAVENHLADKFGYSEDAIHDMATDLQMTDYEVFEYRSTPGLIDSLLGNHQQTPTWQEQIMEASIPRAMYYCSWNPWVPTVSPR
ncbi:MAG: signal peptide peptidase SppA [Planctomycetaceae bacterium]|nr:signal peptide peptidase SppA [Planctomycetaceae bacterium]